MQRGFHVYGHGVRIEERASENRQRKREAGEADKVEVAHGVTVGSLRRFKAADWTEPRILEAASAASIGKLENPERERERVRYYVVHVGPLGTKARC